MGRVVWQLACAASLLSATASAAPDFGYKPRMTSDGWEILFDGTDLSAWDRNPDGWKITPQRELFRAARKGDIWSKGRYCDFILEIEFKVAKGTNSGVFLRTHSRREWLHTGIEVQVLDSAHKATPDIHDTGAVYDIQAPSKNAMKPAGEWNKYIITVDENLITVVLNDVKVNEVDLDKWTEPHKNPDGSKNKFKYAYKDMIREGFLALQDHGDPVWYRNIRIKPLNGRLPRYTGSERYERIVDGERARQSEAMRLRAARAKQLSTQRRPTVASPPAAPKRDPKEVEAERIYKTARQAERFGQRQAAVTMYGKILSDFGSTSFAEKASARLQKLGK